MLRSLLTGALLLGSHFASAAYTWKNVVTGGGGGFVPGIVFHPKSKGVAYARTDIGGLYKLNEDDSWTPVTDSIATNDGWHNLGIDALALDPSDDQKVYCAVGMYTNSWDPDNGSIIRSSDGGATWSFTDLPFKVGGNMPGRGLGERLAVDPNNPDVIYFGARSGNGLWKSTDAGLSFAKVSSFTNVGTYVPDATDTTGYNNDIIGIAWVTFDDSDGTVNGVTKRIFVGVADVNESVFVSVDGGTSWAAVAGQPTGSLPHKGKIAPDGNLYITYANGAGPYDGSNGTVNKYTLSTGEWADITPVSGSDLYFGFGGLAVDMLNSGTIMVATLNAWWPDLILFRSTDSGATWTRDWEWTSYPSESTRYVYDTDNAPWIDNSRASDDTKITGWMVESLEIDPFDSDHWLYGTGLTVYGGHDLTNWDANETFTISSLAVGIEETAVQELVTVPSGPALISGIYDIGGFVHESLTTPPTVSFIDPIYPSVVGLDYAGNNPTDLVRVGNDGTSTDPQVALSSNTGSSWYIFYGAPVGTYGGKIAYSASATSLLWSSASAGVLVSKNSGTFTSVSSLPSGAAIASDKRNDTVFYAASSDTFYLSVDSGATFSTTASLGSSSSISRIRANPFTAGDVWVSTDAGLFHSSDYGHTFTAIASVSAGLSFALGVGDSSAAGGYSIYGFFTVDDVLDLYASDDQGATWTSISDGQNFGADSADVVGASLSSAGLVFVGTNGRGIFYGEE